MEVGVGGGGCLVVNSCLTFCDSMDCLASSFVHGFTRQEYWNTLPFPSSGDIPNPGIECRSPALQMDSLPTEPPGIPNMKVGDSGILHQIGTETPEESSDQSSNDCPLAKTRDWPKGGKPKFTFVE